MNIKIENEKYLELTELSSLIKTKDIRTAAKWCAQNQIPIRIIGKKRLVSKFLVEIELDKDFIKTLKTNHPNKWEELYLCYQHNDKLNYSKLITGSDAIPELFRKKRTKLKSKFAKDFASEKNRKQ